MGAVAALEQGLRRAPYRDTVNALAKALVLSESMKRRFEEVAARARHRVRHDDAAFPVATTSFVERNELEELTALLAHHRLVTITGTGGVGKTRIAIEAARRSGSAFDDSHFIDLLPVRDGEMVAPYVAARLHLPTGADDISAIVRFLRRRLTLLVIDNCEHVIAEAADLVGTLLGRCSSLTILATSREPLALSLELAYRLPPMDSTAAMALFVARAHAFDPSLTMNPGQRAVIADICRSLDGIPLAIELAASRLSSLGFEGLRKRLRDGLPLTGSRDLPSRHQTMVSTIAWSYDLLNDCQRLLFRRLSVFVGGFTLEAAIAVCSEGMPESSVAENVSQLVQKSLVNAEHVGTSTRYRFLDSVRSYAWALLSQTGELESTMERLIAWLTGIAAVVDSGDPPEQLIEQRAELDNVAGVVIWSESTGNREAILAAAKILVGFRLVWGGTSRTLELRTLIYGLLEYLENDEEPAIVGRLIHALFAHLTHKEVAILGPRAIESLESTGLNSHAATIHARVAQAEVSLGHSASVRDHLASVDRLLAEGDSRSSNNGYLATVVSAYVRVRLGELDAARALLESAPIPPSSRLGFEAVVVRAIVESQEGRFDRAIELLGGILDGVEMCPHSGHLKAQIFCNLATYELQRGDMARATRQLSLGLRELIGLRDLGSIAIAVEYARYAAALAALSDRVELAIRLLSASDSAGREHNCKPVDSFGYEIATSEVRKRSSPDEAQAIRIRWLGDDVFDLFEEFLAQPAAANSAFASSTSSVRPTSVMRSSPS